LFVRSFIHPFPLVQIRINIHSFLVPFVTGIHSPLNHAYTVSSWLILLNYP